MTEKTYYQTFRCHATVSDKRHVEIGYALRALFENVERITPKEFAESFGKVSDAINQQLLLEKALIHDDKCGSWTRIENPEILDVNIFLEYATVVVTIAFRGKKDSNVTHSNNTK